MCSWEYLLKCSAIGCDAMASYSASLRKSSPTMLRSTTFRRVRELSGLRSGS